MIDQTTQFQTRAAPVGVCKVLLNLCLQTEFLYMSQMINVECGHVVGLTFVNSVA